MKKLKLSIISLNTMSTRNFDSLHGFLMSGKSLKRQEKIAELLQKTEADILALQEVNTYTVVDILRKKLTAYPYVIYKPYLYGPRGGLILFSRLPLELVEYTNFTKRGTWFNQSFVGHLTKNGILIAKLTNEPLYVLNTHLTPNMDHDWSPENRFSPYIEAQLEQMGSVLKELLKKKDILIAGDFNTAKDSYLYDNFIKKAHVLDVFAPFDFPTQHQEYLDKTKKSKRIDYIFLLNKQYKPVIIATEHMLQKKISLGKNNLQYLSDHIALLAKVSLQKKEK